MALQKLTTAQKKSLQEDLRLSAAAKPTLQGQLTGQQKVVKDKFRTAGGTSGTGFTSATEFTRQKVAEADIQTPKGFEFLDAKAPTAQPEEDPRDFEVRQARFEASQAVKQAQQIAKTTETVRGQQEQTAIQGRETFFKEEGAKAGTFQTQFTNPEFDKLTTEQKRFNTGLPPDQQVQEKLTFDQSMLNEQQQAALQQGINIRMTDDQRQALIDKTTPKTRKFTDPNTGKSITSSLQDQLDRVKDFIGGEEGDVIDIDEDGNYLLKDEQGESVDPVDRAEKKLQTKVQRAKETMEENQKAQMDSIYSRNRTVDGGLSEQGRNEANKQQIRNNRQTAEFNERTDEALDSTIRAEKKRQDAVQTRLEAISAKSDDPGEKLDRLAKEEKINLVNELLTSGAAKSPTKAITLANELLKFGKVERDAIIDRVQTGESSNIESAIAYAKRQEVLTSGQPLKLPDAKLSFNALLQDGKVDTQNAYSEAFRMGGTAEAAGQIMASASLPESFINDQQDKALKEQFGDDIDTINLSKSSLAKQAILRTGGLDNGADVSNYMKNLDKEFRDTPDGERYMRSAINELQASPNMKEVGHIILADWEAELGAAGEAFGQSEFLAGQGDEEQRQRFLTSTRQLAAAKKGERVSAAAGVSTGVGGARAIDASAEAEAQGFLSAFNSGQLTQNESLTRIGKETRGVAARFNALVAEQGGGRVFGSDSGTIEDLNTQIKSLEALKKGGLYKNISGPVQGFGLSPGATGDALTLIRSVLSSQTLDALADAKSKGITFGALSTAEMNTVAAAAGRLSSRKETDEGDNIIGFVGSEGAFLKDLDTLITKLKKAVKVKTGGAATQAPEPQQITPVQIAQRRIDLESTLGRKATREEVQESFNIQ